MSTQDHGTRRSRLGLGIGLAALLGGTALAGWASFIPMNGAAISSGVVVPSGNRKPVQHETGGIVSEILVAEGQTVAAGDVVVRLADTRVRARLEAMRSEKLRLLARMARLEAEALGEAAPLAMPAAVGEAGSETDRVVSLERALYDKHLAASEKAREMTETEIVQIRAQIRGHASERESVATQLALAVTELKRLRPAFEKGHVLRSSFIDAKNRVASLEGRHASIAASIAQAEQRITHLRLTLQNDQLARMEEAHSNLVDTQARLFALDQELRVAEEQVARQSVRAPIDGVVFDLSVNTAGAVLANGETIMEIVPADSPLVVEARIDPSDIDQVYPGQEAWVRMTAHNPRRTGPLAGMVETISADALEDSATGARFYKATLRIEDEGGGDDRPISPGMAADIAMLTEPRTVLDYLLDPVLAVRNRALREP